MATIKTTSTATLSLSQTERYAVELQRIRDSQPARLAALVQQAADTKATILSMGLSIEDYDRLHNLLSKH